MCTIPPCTTKGLHCDANTHIGPIALCRVGAPSPLCIPPGIHRPCKKGGVSGATSKAGSSHVSLSDLVEQMLVSRHVDTAKVSQHNQVQKDTWQESLRRSSWHPTRPPQTMQKRWRFRCHVKSRVIPRLTVGPGGADACVKTCRYGKSVPTQPSTERNRTAPDQPRCPDSISTSNGLKI